jgi:replicative DNA helicase
MTSSEVQEIKQIQVIAKIIYDMRYRSEVTSFLEVQDFVSADFRDLYKAILDLIRENKQIDRMVLQERCPGIDVPSKKVLFTDEQFDYGDLAQRLHEDGNEYRIKAALDSFLVRSGSEDFKFSEEFEALQKTINQPLSDSVGGVVGASLISNLVDRMNRGKIEPVGRTGVSKIDDILGGLEPGLIYTILAAPGVGKSMLGIQTFHECLDMGVTAMYATNEMSELTVMSRLVARETNVSSSEIRRGTIPDGAFPVVHDAMGELHDKLAATNSVIYQNAYDVDKLARAIRYYAMKYGVKTVIVDHMHNFHGSAKIFDRVSQASHALQRVAQELQIAMVILGQMDRASKKSKNVEEKSAKGADDLEEVSDVIIVLTRKKIAEGDISKKENDPNFMQMIITKNREGKTGQTWASVAFPSMEIKQDESGFNF